ncbi:uncharacterized protein AB675_2226 [Cyphellophora attinorum]|uniref:Uncharacterized protein n=1 Tax=Cyphellophora attinorum TaxID=1664694 RepID=A0A0N0NPF9_9EURO|nr:uncharacterized protein AB675_2226 [Phialophora attinorum]KPI42678.1 hypothetical protein AB675_2226 [Phialophora attinorum]
MATGNPDLDAQLQQLDAELEEGDITRKGYEKRRTLILSQYLSPQDAADSDHPAASSSNDGSRAASLAALQGNSRGSTPAESRQMTFATARTSYEDAYSSNNGSTKPSMVDRFQDREMGTTSMRNMSMTNSRSSMLMPDPQTQDSSRTHTLMSQNYAFNPDQQQSYQSNGGGGTDTRNSTMLGDSAQGYFSDFAGQQRIDDTPQEAYGGGAVHRYSQSEITSPTTQVAPPFLSPGCVLVLDQKGKEIVSITWEKLASRAEKVAQVVRDKSSLYKGDRVALIYTESEVIEFAVALMGCFIAGVVAVPINDLKNYARLNVVLTSTQAHLALTTEANLKNFQRDITAAKLSWPRGVEWWKTNEFGSYHPKKKNEEPALVVPDLAYIEFSTAPTGDLRGVVMSHKTIMHQMATLSAMITSATSNTKGDTFNPALRDKAGHLVTGRRNGEIMLSYLDPRQSIGMILGVLMNVYGGHTCIYFDQKAIETPGLYANLITRYRSTLMVADYPGLKRAAYNYQADPLTTRNFKKNFEPNFSSVKLCLIDTLTVDPEFHELVADRWLKPLRNPRAREVVAPMLCLPEHGGMVISMRDWLGGEERMGCELLHEMDHDQQDNDDKEGEKTLTSKSGSAFGSSLLGGSNKKPAAQRERNTEELGEVLLDKEALKTNDIHILAMGSEARSKAASFPNAVRCGAFGYPIPDATLAVVDPESGLLCGRNTIGEIWVDSPSLSGGFWALPRHTETIFHARPFLFAEGNPTPTALDLEFLRTGLLGCVIEGKVYVLGLYEDRLRQRVEWVEHGLQVQEHRYFFVQHLVISIMKSVPKIHDCSAFDCFVNEEHLPIVLLETNNASTAPLTSGGPPQQLDIPLLDSLAERTMEVLYQEHHLRVYCVMVTAPGVLPRVTKNGRREIGNMLCRKEFDNGSLPAVHVKFGVERAVQNLPFGEDPVGGVWSPSASAARAELLYDQETQWSGVDHREVVIDDRTSTSLSNFSNIFDLMQWRVARQADELAYVTIDGRGKEGKALPWKKFDLRVASVAVYLKNKVKLKPADHVILMYTHSEEYVFAIYACMALGVIAIPCAPLDANRLSEDAPAFLHIVADMRVKAVLVNNDVDQLFKQKLVSQHLKQSAQYMKSHIPHVYNTNKPSKQHHGCRDLGLTINKAWVTPNNPVIIWTYWTPDQRRMSIQLGHDTLLGMCKHHWNWLHTHMSYGRLQWLATYLMSPLDFAQNPISLFLALSRYKVKDTYATSQMLDFAMGHVAGKGFSLHEVKNLMISSEARPRKDLYPKVRAHFQQSGLERTAINTIYSHVLNPMVSSRSYMSIEPIELFLDQRALRRGMIYPTDPDSDPNALCVQDSGMVPVSTRIAIVNPETNQLCHVGEYGEIWVQSEACAKSFYMSKQPFDEERFNGRILGGDLNAPAYVRTGDLGFLHNVTRPIGPGNQPVEMQILFVLGGIGETFEVNGLSHFPIDIENSIEKAHRNITPGGSAVFQAGGYIIVVVEVFRKAYLASLVPVIVNAVLNEHQIVVDMVSFVGSGDFPRSRLSEKQRGKILSNWVTKKLRTIAQFTIRDHDVQGQFTQHSSQHTRKTSTGMHSLNKTWSNQDSQNPSPSPGLQQQHARRPSQSQRDDVSRSSIVPEIPLSLPQNNWQMDMDGGVMFEKSAEGDTPDTPSVAVNNRFVDMGPPEGYAEMSAENSPHENRGPPNPSDAFGGRGRQGVPITGDGTANPYLTDEKFAYGNDDSEYFDPEKPFGRSPNRSTEDFFDDAGQWNDDFATPLADPANGPPRLSLVNPSNFSNDDESTPENTPTTYTATPTSAAANRLAQSDTQQTVLGTRAESPYGDVGNPFGSTSVGGVPSHFDVGSPTSATGGTSRFSHMLPSQAARFGGAASRGDSGDDYGTYTSPRQGWSAASEMPSGDETLRPRGLVVRNVSSEATVGLPSSQSQPGGLKTQAQGQHRRNVSDGGQSISGASTTGGPGSSVAGSVRRRYDGSGYDGYEY